MALYYVDIETAGPDHRKDKVITIQYRMLNNGPQPLRILKEWDHPGGERGIVEEFCRLTNFWSRKWDAVPVGWNLSFDLRWIFYKAKHYGIIDFTKEYFDVEKPHIDLHHLAYMFNAGNRDLPEDLAYESKIHPIFYGTKMSDWTRKHGSGTMMFDMYKQKRYDGILGYIEQENAAFEELFQLLRREMPDFWNRRLAPVIGKTAKVPLS